MTDKITFTEWKNARHMNGIYWGDLEAAWQAWQARQPEIDLLNKQIEELRIVCGEAYQLAGAYDADELALDNLSAAANGDPIPHKSFLPVVVNEQFAKYQAEIESLRVIIETSKGQCSYRCIKCGFNYNATGDNEDCPSCGCDGT